MVDALTGRSIRSSLRRYRELAFRGRTVMATARATVRHHKEMRDTQVLTGHRTNVTSTYCIHRCFIVALPPITRSLCFWVLWWTRMRNAIGFHRPP